MTTNLEGTSTEQLPALLPRELPDGCREEVKALLHEVYGYDRFRTLEIYDDLSVGRQTVRAVARHPCGERHPSGRAGLWARLRAARRPTSCSPRLRGRASRCSSSCPPSIWGRRYGLLTLVVSPLKALIVDQVEALQDAGYGRVEYASSDLSPEQKAEACRRVREGEADLFYLSPELLLSYDIRHFVGDRRIGLVVVDEAHTVTTLG